MTNITNDQNIKEWNEISDEIIEKFGNTGHFFHRTLSTYINYIIENGMVIEKLVEPALPTNIASENPYHERAAHVPLFLLIKSRKS